MFDLIKTIFTELPIEPHSSHFIPEHLDLMWVTIYANVLIVFSYLLIPLTAFYVVRNRKDLAYNWVFLLIGGFIFCCGLTHLMHIVVFWHSYYWLQAIMCIITAVISAITFVVLIKEVPKIVKLTSPQQLDELRLKLEEEIANNKSNEEKMEYHNNLIHESNLAILKQNMDLVRLNRFMAGREQKIQELQNELEREQERVKQKYARHN